MVLKGNVSKNIGQNLGQNSKITSRLMEGSRFCDEIRVSLEKTYKFLSKEVKFKILLFLIFEWSLRSNLVMDSELLYPKDEVLRRYINFTKIFLNVAIKGEMTLL